MRFLLTFTLICFLVISTRAGLSNYGESHTSLNGFRRFATNPFQQRQNLNLSVYPAQNASGYKITYDTDGKQVEELVTQSEIEYILLLKVGKSGVKNSFIKAF